MQSKTPFPGAGIRAAVSLFVLAGVCRLATAAESSLAGEERGQVSNGATGA